MRKMQRILSSFGSFYGPVLYQLSYLSGSVHDREIRATVNGRELAMICDLRVHHRRKAGIVYAAAWLCAVALLATFCPNTFGAGETPESSNVKKVVNAALAFLEGKTDERLGGKCLIALAFLKAGKLDHPKVRQAIEECAKN